MQREGQEGRREESWLGGRCCGRPAGLWALLGWVVAAVPVFGVEDEVWLGHYDLAMEYELGSGWRSYLWDHAEQEVVEARRRVLWLRDWARVQVPSGAEYEFLGGAGAEIWWLGETYAEDRLYLGIGAPRMGRNIFSGGLSNRGTVTMRLSGVRGSGVERGGTFTMWASGFPPRLIFSSSAGAGAANVLEGIVANFHGHYNFGFSAAGVYRVAFEISGKLLPEHGGAQVRHEAVFTFAVGEGEDLGGPLRYAWPAAEGWSWSSWMGWVWLEGLPWVYPEGRDWRYIPGGDIDDFWMWLGTHGWVWSSQNYYPWVWVEASKSWEFLL